MKLTSILYDLMMTEKAAIEDIEKAEKRITSASNILDQLDRRESPVARGNVEVALGDAYVAKEKAMMRLKDARNELRLYFEDLLGGSDNARR